MKKRIISLFLATLMIVATFMSFSMVASAASISSDKHTASKVVGGQTVYIKSNTGWNTEVFGDTYRTKIQINLGKDFEIFQYNLSTKTLGKVSVKIYKKSGSSWVLQSGLSGNYNCNNKGYVSTNSSAKTFVLPGKGIEYKVVVTPIITYVTESQGIYKASDMKNISVKITSYGTITKVA